MTVTDRQKLLQAAVRYAVLSGKLVTNISAVNRIIIANMKRIAAYRNYQYHKFIFREKLTQNGLYGRAIFDCVRMRSLYETNVRADTVTYFLFQISLPVCSTVAEVR